MNRLLPSSARFQHSPSLPPPNEKAQKKDSLLQWFKSEDWRVRTQASLPQDVNAEQAAAECLKLVQAFPEPVRMLLHTHADVAKAAFDLLPSLHHDPQLATQLAQALWDAGRDFVCASDFPDSVKDFVAQQLGAQAHNMPPAHRTGAPRPGLPQGDVPLRDHPAEFLDALNRRDLGSMHAAARAIGQPDNDASIQTAFEQLKAGHRTGDLFRLLALLWKSRDVATDSVSDILLKADQHIHQCDQALLREMLVDMASTDPCALMRAMASALLRQGEEDQLDGFKLVEMETLFQDHPQALTKMLTSALRESHRPHRHDLEVQAARLAIQDPDWFAPILLNGLSEREPGADMFRGIGSIMLELTAANPAQSLKLMQMADESVAREGRSTFLSILPVVARTNPYMGPAVLVQAFTHREGPEPGSETLRASFDNRDEDFVKAYAEAVLTMQDDQKTRLQGEAATRVVRYMNASENAGGFRDCVAPGSDLDRLYAKAKDQLIAASADAAPFVHPWVANELNQTAGSIDP